MAAISTPILVCCACLLGCGSGSAHKIGGGPTAYRNYDLRPVTDDGLAAAAVIGFSTVEMLQITDDVPIVTPLVAPRTDESCERMPVAVVPGDYNGDGVLDVWTQEPCGNWINTGPTYPPGVVSVAVLPADPGPYEYVEYFATDDGAIVLGGTTSAVYMLRRIGSTWSEPSWLSIPQAAAVRVTNLWAPLQSSGTSQQFLFQARETLYVLTAAETQISIARTLTQVVEPPYVRPFLGFDHLTTLEPRTCPGVAVGIGVFHPEAGNTTRHLAMLTLEGSTYRVSEPSLGLEELTTFSVTALSDGQLLVGSLGFRGGRRLFVLDAVEDCTRLTRLAELEVEFALRTPPLPSGYDKAFVPLTNAVQLVPFVSAGQVRFVHYDGYDLRVIVAEQNGSGWQLEERRHEIHSHRNDSAFD